MPNTADERERRFVQYIATLNKGQLAEVKLRRLNRVANLRKTLIDLINNMVEERAEDLAAGMLMEWAPERAKPKKLKVVERLPELKRRKPVWVANNSAALTNSFKRGQL